MLRILQVALGVLVGNLLTLGLLFVLVDYGVLGVDRTVATVSDDNPDPVERAEPSAESPASPGEVVGAPAEPPELPPPRGAAKARSIPHTVRVSIPGHPVEECLDQGRELNDQVVRCSAQETITLSAPEPITDVGQTARAFLREGCLGSDWAGDPQMQRKMCDLHDRIQRYGYSVVP
ncbi:MAG: hypothetical protein R3310_06315 [Candidatus Competibacteraceae bacterium]|nr:hypothetical protein [Candidatus Competibacteraceae bacterium]